NRAPVLAPGSFVMTERYRAFLAVGDRRQTVRGNAEGDQVVLDGSSTALAEGEVVFARAALIAVTFDLKRDSGVGVQPCGLALQRSAGFISQVIFVKGEED